jgi:crotonobetainyl-CoA:carnitine CoA-transferase CaiB-like acyl-CoA transferase
LDYATLAKINPGLIVVDSSAFGPTGPWSRRLGYGPLVRASAGLAAQWRYPEDPTSFSDAITVYPDHVAGRVGAIGVLALLIRRLHTGIGGSVSIAQAEVMFSHVAPQIAAAALTASGIEVTPAAAHDVPWGVFPCRGDDEWCVVTVRDDTDWLSLCLLIGRQDLGADRELAMIAGRDANRARIDAALCEWLAERTPLEAMEQLQAAGVPAGAMLRVSELPDFPYYRERGFFRLTQHPHIKDPMYIEVAPVHSKRLPNPPERPAPLQGEHTIEIVSGELGIGFDEVTALINEKVLEIPAPIETLRAAS